MKPRVRGDGAGSVRGLLRRLTGIWVERHNSKPRKYCEGLAVLAVICPDCRQPCQIGDEVLVADAVVHHAEWHHVTESQPYPQSRPTRSHTSSAMRDVIDFTQVILQFTHPRPRRRTVSRLVPHATAGVVLIERGAAPGPTSRTPSTGPVCQPGVTNRVRARMSRSSYVAGNRLGKTGGGFLGRRGPSLGESR